MNFQAIMKYANLRRRWSFLHPDSQGPISIPVTNPNPEIHVIEQRPANFSTDNTTLKGVNFLQLNSEK